ncbi:RCC1 domain-containing protein [Catellatospora tritici]|uniref:RCC1 domain-containing protein n=1 Tax=Catellatospora tritici TaxID=2851566 RepID=UPI001C2D8E72|nr:RCC1 domain-containing protein [Catellatospora tritici]MBV1852248.1 cell wall anchor protein [Catellatospora tritici]
MRITTALRGLGAVAVTTMLTLVAPAVAFAEDKDGGQGGKTKVVLAQGAEAWGVNRFGQLGNGSLEARPSAVTVAVPDGVRAVAAGGAHSLFLLSNGTVKAAGLNALGQLGDGTRETRAVPGNVIGLSGVKAIAAGYDHSLALLNDGTMMAWGTNSDGQLGIGTTTPTSSDLPLKVVGLKGKVTAIAAGDFFSLALLADGTVQAWGENRYGQLGNGTTSDQPQPTPVTVSGLTGVRAIDGGATHSLAALRDGSVRSWGDNSTGQLGTGDTTPSSVPVPVVQLGAKVKAVAAGDGYSLALTEGGKVKGWGENSDGELGDGTYVSPRLTPVNTVDLTGVTAISAGTVDKTQGGHSLAVSGNVVKAWGLDIEGSLGIGPVDNSNVPVTVRTGLNHPRSVSAGQFFSLAS